MFYAALFDLEVAMVAISACAQLPRRLLGALLVIAFAAYPAVGLAAEQDSRTPAAIDPDAFCAAIVKIETRALPDARSIATLGGEREGTGIVIDSAGLVLTIGYLLVEADEVRIID